MKFTTLFFLIITFICNSQEIKVSISVKDIENRGIESASVIILDKEENIVFNDYTNEVGFIQSVFEKCKLTEIKIEVAALGFKRKSISIILNSEKNYKLNFELEANSEVLKEVVIESYQKIRVKQDTTFIKVEKFTNQTEQTLEDVLKKLPGITVQPDGSIKAHGKPIDKLLIDGDDVFDKNYKLLSKNLDAKVVDEVQILDNFEDNPILKRLSDSDKVALNIKFKKGYSNVWFGNATIGLGTQNRLKGSLNLGLLRKKIKLFYFGDYNNIGEKGSNQILENQETIDFSDSSKRIEKTTKTIYTIDSKENTVFSNSQSLFNRALTNSISISSRVNKKLQIRAIGYFINDVQNQNSNSFTQLNIYNDPISFTENSFYKSNKTLSSAELELKFFANNRNYYTNYTVYKNNPQNIINDIVFNENSIQEESKNIRESFYNHLEHTFEVAENKILKNYFYFGYSHINESTIINSPLLNNFLSNPVKENIYQNSNNKLQYYGVKSTLSIIRGYWLLNSTFNINNEEEIINSDLKNESEIFFENYKNKNLFKQFIYCSPKIRQ